MNICYFDPDIVADINKAFHAIRKKGNLRNDSLSSLFKSYLNSISSFTPENIHYELGILPEKRATRINYINFNGVNFWVFAYLNRDRTNVNGNCYYYAIHHKNHIVFDKVYDTLISIDWSIDDQLYKQFQVYSTTIQNNIRYYYGESSHITKGVYKSHCIDLKLIRHIDDEYYIYTRDLKANHYYYYALANYLKSYFDFHRQGFLDLYLSLFEPNHFYINVQQYYGYDNKIIKMNNLKDDGPNQRPNQSIHKFKII
jgi:hypothetical protein